MEILKIILWLLIIVPIIGGFVIAIWALFFMAIQMVWESVQDWQRRRGL